MAKLHTRQRRRLKMRISRKRGRSPRPKTFKTEESAKKHAEKEGIKSYKLVNLRSFSPTKKKIRIVAE